MHIKATIVAYAFLVQHFENTTIVAYEGTRVKFVIPSKLPLVTKGICPIEMVPLHKHQWSAEKKYFYGFVP